eukprot:c29427_g1_i1 orf=408-635(-)
MLPPVNVHNLYVHCIKFTCGTLISQLIAKSITEGRVVENMDTRLTSQLLAHSGLLELESAGTSHLLGDVLPKLPK